MRIANIINLDSPPLLTKHGEWSYAQNIQLSDKADYAENEDILIKDFDLNNDKAHYLGKLVLPNSVLLFYYVAGVKPYLNIINPKTNENIRIRDKRYEYTKIHSAYTFNYKGELIFTVGCRSTSTNTPELLIINWEENKNKLINLNTKEYDDILLHRDWFNKSYPSIKLNSISNTGSLLSGSYFISMCYEDKNGNRSNFINTTNKIIITETNIASNKQTGKAITLNINDINQNYPYYRLAILYYNNSTLSEIRITEEIETSNNVYTISSLAGSLMSSLEEITINTIKYTRAKSSVNNANKLLLFNTRTEDYKYKEFQKVANNIIINVVDSKKITSPSYNFPTYNTQEAVLEAHNNSSYKSNEPYLFYIRFISNKGEELSINYIPYNPLSNMDSFDLQLNYDSEFVDLAGQPIKTYKFPKIKIVGLSRTQVTRYHILASNVIIPDELKDICAGWEILYAERNIENTRSLGQLYIPGAHPAGGQISKYRVSAYSFNLQYTNFNLDSITRLERSHVIKFGDTGEDIIDYIEYENSNTYRFDFRNYISTDVPEPFSDAYYDNIIDTSLFTKFEYASNMDEDSDDRIEIWCTKLINSGFYDIIINDLPYRNGIYNQKLVSTGKTFNRNKTSGIIQGGDIVLTDIYHRVTGALSRVFPANVVPSGANNIIVHYWSESPYIHELRHEGKEEWQKLYPSSTWAEIGAMPTDKGSYINDAWGNSYDLTYSKINNIFNLKLDKDEYETVFKNRIAVSDVNNSESNLLGWRVFKANSYYDIGFNRGEGIKLVSSDKSLYIQNRYGLFYAEIKDVLELTDNNKAWLGTGDLFDRPPTEILYDDTGGIGCNDYYSSIHTKFGYVVYDRDYDSIYLINEGVEDITNNGFKRWIKDSVNKIKPDIVSIGFDNERRRLMIHTGNHIVSYNLLIKGLTSFHTYDYIDLFTNRSGVYIIKENNTIDKFESKPTNLPSFIDINIIIEPATQKLFQSIIWESQYEVDNKKVWNKTIDKIMVYNDTQCTGLLPVNNNDMWYDSNTGVHVSDEWVFNNIFDAVLDDKKPFFTKLMPNNNVNNNTQNWYDKSQIISKFVIVRLHSDNNNNQRIKFLNIKVSLIKNPR